MVMLRQQPSMRHEVWCLVPIVLGGRLVRGFSFWQQRLDTGELQRQADEAVRVERAVRGWKPVGEWIHHDSFNVADAFLLDPDQVKLLKRQQDRLAE